MTTCNETILGKAMCGDTGQPGSNYDCIWVTIARLGDDVFEATAKWSRGSNQGHLEEHDGFIGRHRAETPSEALSELLCDVIDWETGHAAGRIRTTFKDCLYDAED